MTKKAFDAETTECQQRFPSTIVATQLAVTERAWVGLPEPNAKCSLKRGHSGPHMCEQPPPLEQP